MPINLLPACFMKMIKIILNKEADETIISSAKEQQKTTDIGDYAYNKEVAAARWRLNDRGAKSYIVDYEGLHNTCVEANATLKE